MEATVACQVPIYLMRSSRFTALELAQTLRDKGLPLPEGILTVSDMVKELKNVLCPSK